MKTLKTNLLIRIASVSVIILLLNTTVVSQNHKHAAYIDSYSPIAIALMHEYQIPASVILGVAMVESGAGTSALSRKFHNHFGLVGKNTNAVKKLGRHTKYREFESDTASFRYFCDVISRKKFFPKLANTFDHRQWVTAIMNSGYAAAAGHWQQQVLIAIKKYKLTAYDTPEPDPLNYLPRTVNGVKTNGMLVNSYFVPVKNEVSAIPASSSRLKASK